MLGREANAEEDKLEKEVVGEDTLELLYPGEVVAANVEGDGREVEGDISLNAIECAVEEGGEGERWIGLGG